MKTIAWAIVAALFLSLSGNVSSKAVAQSPEPQSAYKLKDVIVTSFGFQGNPAVNRSPLSMALGYTEVEWTFNTPGNSRVGASSDADAPLMKRDGSGPFSYHQDFPVQAVTLGYTEVEWTFITLLELGFTADEASCLAASYGN
jgi:type VI protein secretion system component Hcp